MKNKFPLLLLLTILFVITPTKVVSQKNKSYSEDWKQVEYYTQKQRPESALKKVNTIYQKAKTTNNNPQILKAMMYQVRLNLDKNPDEFQKQIKSFEAKAKQLNPIAQSVAFHLTAKLYESYQNENYYHINRRKELKDYTPKDIKEWTNNLFARKIKELTELSLKNKSLLQNTNLLTYSDILEKGKLDTDLMPTMFDFLVFYAIGINNNEKAKLYEEVIDFHKKKKNTPTLIYWQLQKLNLTTKKKDENYLKELNKLIKRHSNSPFIVEVLAEKANYLLSKNKKREAYKLVKSGINKFSDYKRIDLLKNIKEQILNKYLKLKSEKKYAEPNTQIDLTILSKNISEVELLVYRTALSGEKYAEYSITRDLTNLNKHWQKIESKRIKINKDRNFGMDTTNIEVKTKEYGIYRYLLKDKKQDTEVEIVLTVTDFISLAKRMEEKSIDFLALNREKGNPIKNSWIKIYESSNYPKKFVFLKKVKTDKNGLAELCEISKDINGLILLFEKGKDTFYSKKSYSHYYGGHQTNNDKNEISLFIDRSLYRPGQTVYFKGIAYNRKKQKVVTDKVYTIRLHDANSKVVSTKEMKTNSFGSFAGSFVLPQSGLNGRYYIRVEKMYPTTTYFNVEDYKRPTFEVEIKKPEKEVRFGEKIAIKGVAKSYVGFPTSNAKVKYKISRRPHFLCWWIPYHNDKIIADGTIQTDKKGKFEIEFIAKKEPNRENENQWWYRKKGTFYTYSITTEITDSKGETQSGEQSFSVGDKSLFILTDFPDELDKTKLLKQKIEVQTINGKTVEAKVNYQVVRLQAPDKYYENIYERTQLKELKTVLKGTFLSKDSLTLHLNKLPSGLYKIRFTTKDNRGSKIENEKRFILYSLADKKLSVKKHTWLYAPKKELNVGEVATLRFGTSDKKASVLYEIMNGYSIIERHWVQFNNEIKTFKIPFKEEYKKGITVSFMFVKKGKIFTKRMPIKKKKENKIEQPFISVFRNKLQPNSKENWSVTVPNTKSKEKAELLISMYDASLDAIKSHSWTFNPTLHISVPYSSNWQKNSNYTPYRSNQHYYRMNEKYPTPFNLPKINWLTIGVNYDMCGSLYPKLAVSRVGAPLELNGLSDDEVVVVGAGKAKESPKLVGAIGKKKEKKETKKQIKVKARENFNETAFFYPQLRTDKQGNVKIEFTVPEALTRWNVNLLSHTQNLYYGQNQLQVVTQKDLIVQMNLPRFIRQEDKLNLMANVVNLSGKNINTDVTLQIIDPKTEKVVYEKTHKGKSLVTDETKAIEWELPTFPNYDLVIVKVVAVSDKFSDGEQKYLPILPNKVLVTESMPMTVRKNETKTFNINHLIQNWENVETKNFTVEFSTNPIWYAVQAMPTVAEPKCENAIDYLSAYYVNRLANHIVTSNPKIKTVFSQWKQENSQALVSNLSKNQELKNVQLEETPWVLDAQNETEQKQQIATLFDKNMQKNNAETYLNKLFDLQTSNGGFSWIIGMPDSRYITQKVLLNLAQIKRMTNEKFSIKYQRKIQRAIRYLDLKIAEDFNRLKRYNKDYYKQKSIGNTQLFYLHVRSEYNDIPIEKSAAGAVNFYTGQAEKYWTDFTLYGQAMMAQVAHKNNNKWVMQDIITSLKENAIKSKEQGMYWVKNRAGWFWYERPIAIQSAIIDTWIQTNSNAKDVEEMKIWLLQQKQTQRWSNPQSTIDAIYALLNSGSDWLSESGNTTVSLGNKVLNENNKETATGYFKKQIPISDLTTKKENITIKNSNSSLGWGAAYWQYFQDADKVKSQGKELNISKKMFVEKVENGKKVLTPIEKVTLQKGEKVITRLVVKTDRNLTFVSLKDLRASCFEPLEQISTIKYREGTRFYQTTKDTSTQFYFEFLPKGTYVFENEMWVNNTGEFTSGITSLQCMYAPEFTAHSKGQKISVK